MEITYIGPGSDAHLFVSLMWDDRRSDNARSYAFDLLGWQAESGETIRYPVPPALRRKSA